MQHKAGVVGYILVDDAEVPSVGVDRPRNSLKRLFFEVNNARTIWTIDRENLLGLTHFRMVIENDISGSAFVKHNRRRLCVYIADGESIHTYCYVLCSTECMYVLIVWAIYSGIYVISIDMDVHTSTHTDWACFIEIHQISQVLGEAGCMVHNSGKVNRKGKVNHKGSSVGLMYFSEEWVLDEQGCDCISTILGALY